MSSTPQHHETSDTQLNGEPGMLSIDSTVQELFQDEKKSEEDGPPNDSVLKQQGNIIKLPLLTTEELGLVLINATITEVHFV